MLEGLAKACHPALKPAWLVAAKQKAARTLACCCCAAGAEVTVTTGGGTVDSPMSALARGWVGLARPLEPVAHHRSTILQNGLPFFRMVDHCGESPNSLGPERLCKSISDGLFGWFLLLNRMAN